MNRALQVRQTLFVTLNTSELVEATTLPFGLGVVSAISPIAVNDAYNGFPSSQVSCVCIGHRVSGRSAFGLQIDTIVSGLSHPGVCHTPAQAAQPSGHCSNQALRATSLNVKGRTADVAIASRAVRNSQN